MEIYRRYGPALLRKCERILMNRDDAEDIVQTLFVELIKKGNTNVDLPYLYRACTNRCLNLLRDRKKRRDLLEREYRRPDIPVRTLIENQLVDAQLLALLVKRLDKKSSEILVYRYLDDMTQDEIAGMMKLSRKTVGKRLKKITAEARKVRARQSGGFS